MRKLFKYILTLTVFGWMVGAVIQPAWAKEYYLSPSGIDVVGDGGWNNPWQTLEYGIKQLVPGDTLALRGGTYQNGAVSLTAADSGTALLPKTVKAYGNEEAIISSRATLVFEDVSWWNFQGLKFTDFTTAVMQVGLHSAIADGNPTGKTVKAANLKFANLEFSNNKAAPISIVNAENIDIDTVTFLSNRPGVSYGSGGKDISCVSVEYIATNITVQNSYLEECGSDGVLLGARSDLSGSDIRDISIVDNQIFINSPYTGILGNAGKNGIEIMSVKGNIVIRGNNITGYRPTNNGQDTSSGQGEAVVVHAAPLSGGATGVSIEKNYFFDNTRHLSIKSGANNITVSNNIFHKGVTASTDVWGTVEGTGISITDNAHDIRLYHNTLDDAPALLEMSDAANVQFTNNIIINGGFNMTIPMIDVNNPTGPRGTHTAWFNITGEIPYVLLTNMDPNSPNDQYMIEPKLNAKHKPLSDSPVVNSGTDAGVTDDIEGAPRDSQPDIGAYEFGAVAPTATPGPDGFSNNTAGPPTATPTPIVVYTPGNIIFMGLKLGDFKIPFQDFIEILEVLIKTIIPN